MATHNYKVKIEWTGNRGAGTRDYRAYDRNHVINAVGKLESIPGSSDPAFLGDKSRYNPEELFVSALSSCHMLWYLHLCAVNNIVVISYEDNATGVMEEDKRGGGKFTEVTLFPKVIITDEAKIEKANELHEEANQLCFIANSCNFPIQHQSITKAVV
ncbi:MAG TPA: OsmC family protein [Cyclobacteriaceae bacterium]